LGPCPSVGIGTARSIPATHEAAMRCSRGRTKSLPLRIAPSLRTVSRYWGCSFFIRWWCDGAKIVHGGIASLRQGQDFWW